MSLTRLPPPEAVIAPCKLCGVQLPLSADNPQRVCFACGERNLPADQAGAPGVSFDWAQGLSLDWFKVDGGSLAIGLGTPPLTALLLGLAHLAGGGNALAVVPLVLTASCLAALLLAWRRKRHLMSAATSWLLGLLLSIFITSFLGSYAMALFIGFFLR